MSVRVDHPWEAEIAIINSRGGRKVVGTAFGERAYLYTDPTIAHVIQ